MAPDLLTDEQAPAGLSGQAAQAMHGLSLRFADTDLETRYREANTGGALLQLRISIVVGALVNVAFLVIEQQVLNENLATVLYLRSIGGVGVFFLALGVTYLEPFKRRPAWVAAPVIGCFAVTYAAIIGLSDAPDIYVTGFVLVILFTLFFVPLGFPATSLLTVAVTVLFTVLVTMVRSTEVGSLFIIYTQFVAALALGMVGLYWLERLRRRNFLHLQDIARERARYHNLLNRILPSSIVDRLERGETEIADDFAESTVLFADIVGFTEASARHQPSEVLVLLNRVFRTFDDLVALHELEKIKTIGDAYMVAGGLPRERAGHCQAIARLALGMMRAVVDMSWPDGTPIRLRVGIHSGPLIAGIIGDSRFVYDLWGDTVNLASRMESEGRPGHIQVSERAYELLRGEFVLEARGEIEIKGKEPMQTWFLIEAMA